MFIAAWIIDTVFLFIHIDITVVFHYTIEVDTDSRDDIIIAGAAIIID